MPPKRSKPRLVSVHLPGEERERRLPLQDALAVARQGMGRSHSLPVTRLLEEIQAQAPRELEILAHLLEVYAHRGWGRRAAEIEQRLASRHPRALHSLFARARYRAGYGDVEEALRLAELAGKLHGRHAACGLLAGHFAESLGDREGAVTAYRAVLRADRQQAYALWALARLAGREGLPDFPGRIETALSRAPKDSEAEALLHFAAAEASNDDGHDEESRAHFAAANENCARRRPWDPREEAKRCARRIAWVEEAAAAAPDATVRSADPGPVFIANLPRSGGTLLQTILSAHPDCRSIGESMAFAFAIEEAADAAGLPGEHGLWPQESLGTLLPAVRERFESHGKVALDGRRVVDKSIENALDAGLILMALPRARLVALRRHPLDTALSCYRHHFTSGYPYIYRQDHLVAAWEHFEECLAAWERLFPARVVTVHYEDLVRHPEETCARLAESLRLEGLAPPGDDHGAGVVATASSLQVREPIHVRSAGRWQRHREELATAIASLEAAGHAGLVAE